MKDPLEWNRAIREMFGVKSTYTSVTCSKCGQVGPHHCVGKQEPCLFDGLDPNKAYGIACTCRKCSVRCKV